MRMTRVEEVVSGVLEDASGDVKAAREALEDGAYLFDAGYRDADQGAIEEAHDFLKKMEV